MSEEKEKEKKPIKVGSLWKHTSRMGEDYFAGTCSFRILIFENRSKKGANSPDYYMCVADRKQPENPDDKPEHRAQDDDSDSSAA